MSVDVSIVQLTLSRPTSRTNKTQRTGKDASGNPVGLGSGRRQVEDPQPSPSSLGEEVFGSFAVKPANHRP